MNAAVQSVGTVHARASGRWGLVALALLAPVGPLAVALLRYVLPYETPDATADLVGESYADPNAMSLVLWLTLVATLTIVPGAIAVGRLVQPHVPRLTAVALTLTVPGYLMLPMLASLDNTVWMGAETGASQASTVALLDAAHPSVAVATGIFVVGHVLGTVLLGLALLRSGRVPAWAAIATIVSQPLHFVSAVIVPNHAVDGLAWCLNALGFGMAAVAIIRTSPPTNLPPTRHS